MVRQVTAKKTPLWKPLAAIIVAAGALLWHLLACIESPMSFSPAGDLAFVTMEPYDGDDLAIAGKHTFRLMVMSKERKLRVLERTDSYMLTAPAFSPDGKKIAYLRIPLLTAEELKRLEEAIKAAKADDEATTRPAAPLWPSRAPATQQAEGERQDLALPSLEAMEDMFRDLADAVMIPVELVVRDAATGKISAATLVQVPLSAEDDKNDVVTMNLLTTYLLVRPQYAPDGEWVHFGVQNFVLAVNPATGDQRLLGTAAISLLSPDGRNIAAIQRDALAIIQADGQKATYVRLEEAPSPSGLAWSDNRTLALMRPSGDKDQPQVQVDFVGTDGIRGESQAFALPGQGKATQSGELAISPDGKHLAVSFGPDAYILNRDGKVLKAWHLEDEVLAQPTFAPDSKSVAFKHMSKEQKRVTAIVFFALDGKEIARVKIPPAAAATQPATQPKGKAWKPSRKSSR